MMKIIKSERTNMLDREYTLYARSEAAAYGYAAMKWIEWNEAKEAARLARLAARWALKIIGRT